MTRDEAIGLFQTYLRRTPQEADIAVHIHKSKESFEAEISACPERTQLLENSLKQAVEDVVLHRMSTLDFRLERGFSGSTSTSYVIDCGAWDGSETLALLKQFPNSMVVVIEPVREMYEKHLLPKLGNNSRVKILPMAVDGKTGFRKFNINNKHHFVSSFFFIGNKHHFTCIIVYINFSVIKECKYIFFNNMISKKSIFVNF